MKRTLLILVVAALFMGAGRAAFQAITPQEPIPARFVPTGALLYLQAKDFLSLLGDWNSSSEKQRWVKSANYEVFSNSRLLLRLKDAGQEFSTAAGLPADMKFTNQVAGGQSVLVLYDIGKLQFLYITRLPSADATRSALWQGRAKFETRSAGGVTFFYRNDPEHDREVAFATTGDYLLLSTREDLMASALELIAGKKDRSIEADSWWAQSVASAGPAGDLRMVLNLEKIVPSPYFRSYWIQQNITDMKQYSAAISDLFRSGSEYREERILFRKNVATSNESAVAGEASVADLVRLVPADAGFYEVKANPSAEICLALLETKLLAPHLGPAPAERLAPQFQLSNGETGASSDLETRIDLPPVPVGVSTDTSGPLKELLKRTPVQAILQTQSTERDKDGVFVRMHSGVALLAESEWNDMQVRSALVEFARPSLTTSQLGVEWQNSSGTQQLNGLWTLAVAVRGKYLFVSDSPELLGVLLGGMKRKVSLAPAVFVAGFQHDRERNNFALLTRLLDRSGGGLEAFNDSDERSPYFFSGNMGSLSSTLSALSSSKIVARDAGDKVTQTVTYTWSR